MFFFIILAIIASMAMIVIAAISNKGDWQKKDKDHTPIKPRSILTIKEQSIFLKLRKALPDYIVLTQVALSAILCSNGQVTRNKLNRYRADFVILDKDFSVLAIIALEDPSQKVVEMKNHDRTAMCKEADYPIIHYSHIPDIEQIHRDFSTIGLPRPSVKFSESASPSKQLISGEESFFDHDF